MINTILQAVPDLLGSGAGNLAAYLAAHVLLCLLPAFLIAGAMTALIPKETITRYLGPNTPAYISYPAAAAAGFLLAVCSCTVIPLFAGIYKKGAGLGPALTFLFVAPAVNVLALTYTGAVLGLDLAVARLLLSLAFGMGIGLIMALIFWRDDARREARSDRLFAGGGTMRGSAVVFLLILVVLLLAGTFQISVLTRGYARVEVPVGTAYRLETALHSLIPFDTSLGEEGVTAQGAVLIGLLALIGVSAWQGLEDVYSGLNLWTWGTLGLVSLTLLIASLGFEPRPEALELVFTGKFFAVFLSLAALFWLGITGLTGEEARGFLWESWRFVKQIFPLLLIGVFAVGVIRELIRPEWIQALAGRNTVLGNFTGVVFGVFMYFPTLVEVPIAQMFLRLGMHRGPLLAYLIADPELSLQSILITASIIGRVKAWVYVFWVSLFSTLAGLLYGAWVNGIDLLLVALYLLGVLSLVGGGIFLLERWKASQAETAAAGSVSES